MCVSSVYAGAIFRPCYALPVSKGKRITENEAEGSKRYVDLLSGVESELLVERAT